MKKKQLMIVGVIVILAAAGGYLLTKKNKDDNKAAVVNTALANNPTTNKAAASLFNVYQGSYTAQIKTVKSGSTSTTSTIQVKDGTTYSVTSDTSEFIADAGNFYIKGSDGKWIKYPSSQSGSPAAAFAGFAGYLQSPALLALYAGASNKGTGSCSTGTCTTFDYTNPQTKETVEIKVDQKNNRLAEINSTNSTNGTQTIISYDYSTKVDIVIPTDAQSISIPTTPTNQ